MSQIWQLLPDRRAGYKQAYLHALREAAPAMPHDMTVGNETANILRNH